MNDWFIAAVEDTVPGVSDSGGVRRPWVKVAGDGVSLLLGVVDGGVEVWVYSGRTVVMSGLITPVRSTDVRRTVNYLLGLGKVL